LLNEGIRLTRKLHNLALSLWDDSYLEELQNLWKEGCFTAKKMFASRFDKRGELDKVIDGGWQNARTLAQKAGITHKSAVKLLKKMAEAGDIEMHEELWVDERFRKRKRYLYRKADNKGFLNLYQEMFGSRVPDIPCCAANVRVHSMGDDQ
jgi:hypothetical protein